MKPVIHVTYREGLSPVFPSQVATPMAKLQKRGRDVVLFAFAPLGQILRPAVRKRFRQRVQQVRGELRMPMWVLPSPPARARGLWRDSYVLALYMRRAVQKLGKPPILHCRNAWATRIALDARPVANGYPVVYSCRGALEEEYLNYWSKGRDGCKLSAMIADAERLRVAEIRAARESDAVVCVSDRMKNHLCRKSGIEPSKVTVAPCCIDMSEYDRARVKREHIRAELGFGDKFVVTYCGSMAPWQMPERMAQVFRRITQLMVSAHFFAITTRPQALQSVFSENGVGPDEATFLRVPHTQVPAYLAAGDLGLLVREENIVNRVASPTKFAEYLAAGTPVAISEGIGDYSDLVRTEGIGFVLGSGLSMNGAREFILEYRAEPGPIRERCACVARSALTWDSAIGKIEDVYRHLSGAVS
jgi:glycosyltransferase involved in cell wall biosynthesis